MKLSTLTNNTLKQICRDNKISGFSYHNKDGLVSLINDNMTKKIKKQCKKNLKLIKKKVKITTGKNNPHRAKKIEDYVIQLLKGISLDGSDEYKTSAIKINELITPLMKGSVYNNVYKPRVVNTKWGSKTEPKTDIVVNSLNKKYSFSLKKKDSDRILVSTNSPTDFLTQFIDIHDGRNILDEDMISKLEKCSNYIKKIPNFSSYDSSYMKTNDVEGFVKDKFLPKAIKYINVEDATRYSNVIISCYNNPILQKEYKEYLHESESFIRETISLLLTNYPDYSKKILYEFTTGKIKFSEDECSCDYVVSSDGLYELPDYNCDYINTIYKEILEQPKKFIRLRNCPRKSITKEILSNGDSQQIANSFAVADLTFKI